LNHKCKFLDKFKIQPKTKSATESAFAQKLLKTFIHFFSQSFKSILSIQTQILQIYFTFGYFSKIFSSIKIFDLIIKISISESEKFSQSEKIL